MGYITVVLENALIEKYPLGNLFSFIDGIVNDNIYINIYILNDSIYIKIYILNNNINNNISIINNSIYINTYY